MSSKPLPWTTRLFWTWKRAQIALYARVSLPRAVDLAVAAFRATRPLAGVLPDGLGATAVRRALPGDRSFVVHDTGVAPEVWLVHGWNGAAAQLAPLAAAFQAEGRSVRLFDLPGHGAAAAPRSDLGAMIAALSSALRRDGPPAVIVAHSLGGAAVVRALADLGVAPGRLVLVGVPAYPPRYPLAFARALLPAWAQGAFMARFSEIVGHPPDALSVPALDVGAPALLVHDASDREVPFGDAEAIGARWSNATVLRSQGLRHRRVLADPEVVEAIVAFATRGAVLRLPGEGFRLERALFDRDERSSLAA